jgi:hypothetical protein
VELQLVMDLLRSELEKTKDEMVSCDPLDFEKLQGKAQAFDGLIKTMTKPSLKTIKEQNG